MNVLRQSVKTRIEERGISLRQLSEESGVSFATLSRFLRGSDLSWRLFEALEKWVEGKPQRKRKEVMVRRFSVAGKTFLIRVEELERKP